MFVGPFVRRTERPTGSKFYNVYVKNLAESVTEEAFNEMFAKFGTITSAVLMKDAAGKMEADPNIQCPVCKNQCRAQLRIQGFHKLSEQKVTRGLA